MIICVLVFVSFALTGKWIGHAALNVGSVLAVRVLIEPSRADPKTQFWLGRAAKFDSSAHLAASKMALVRYARGDHVGSVAALGAVRPAELRSADYQVLGDSYAAMGDRAAAVQAWAFANSEAAFAAENDWETVLAILEVKLQHQPDSLPSLLLLSEAYTNLGQPDLAVSALCRATRQDPMNAAVQMRLAQALSAMGRWEEAEQVLQSLTALLETGSLAPDDRKAVDLYHDALLHMAYIQKTRGETDLARVTYERVKSRWPNDLTPAGHLADILLQNDRPEEALRQLQPLIGAGRVEDYALRAGRAYLVMDEPAAALIQLEAALAAQPRHPVVRTYTGHALCQLGRREEANRMYASARELGSRDTSTCPAQ